MKRQFFALAAMALLASSANQPTATTAAPATAQHKASPTKPDTRAPQTDSTQGTAQATQPRVLRQRPLALGGSVHHFHNPGPRRVKYGKSRWIVLS